MSVSYDLPPEVQVEADGPIRIIRFNRPDDLNAVNASLHAGMARVFVQVDADPEARVAVVTGNGRAFSAGGDFDLLHAMSHDEA